MAVHRDKRDALRGAGDGLIQPAGVVDMEALLPKRAPPGMHSIMGLSLRKGRPGPIIGGDSGEAGCW